MEYRSGRARPALWLRPQALFETNAAPLPLLKMSARLGPHATRLLDRLVAGRDGTTLRRGAEGFFALFGPLLFQPERKRFPSA